MLHHINKHKRVVGVWWKNARAVIGIGACRVEGRRLNLPQLPPRPNGGPRPCSTLPNKHPTAVRPNTAPPWWQVVQARPGSGAQAEEPRPLKRTSPGGGSRGGRQRPRRRAACPTTSVSKTYARATYWHRSVQGREMARATPAGDVVARRRVACPATSISGTYARATCGHRSVEGRETTRARTNNGAA